MQDQFGGVRVEEPSPTDQFGGVRVEEEGFMDRSGDSLSEGWEGIKSALSNEEYDPASRVQTALSEGINAGGEIASDLLITGGKAVLPQGAQDVISSGFKNVMESAPVQAMGEMWGQAEEAFPEATRRAGELFNIAAVATPTARIPKPDAKAYGMKRGKQGAVGRKEEVKNMLQPDPKDAEGVMDTKGGLMDRNDYRPSAWEQGVIDEVTKVKGVKPRGSYSHNRKAVQAEADRLRVDVDKKLKGAAPIPVQTVVNKVIATVNKTAKKPVMAGDAGGSAVKVFEQFQEIIKDATKGKATISMDDLLQVRRDLDNMAEDWIGGMFSEGMSARKIAVTDIRNSLNDLVAEGAPRGVNVKKSLQKQSRLLAARDIMAPRAMLQKGNRITRGLESLERAVGIKHPTTPVAAKTALMDVPVAASMALIAAFVGLGKPMTRAARATYHQALKALDKGIAAGGDEAQVAARLALIDILKSNDPKDDEDE